MKQTAVKNIVLKGWLAAALLASGAASAAELLNSSYDISRELFTALNSGFEQQWNQQHPHDKLTIKQSHAGSSKQALAILQGLRADVVTYNQVTDVQILHDRGQLISAGWQSRFTQQQFAILFHHGVLGAQGQPERHPHLARSGA